MEQNLCDEQEQYLLAFKNIFDAAILEKQFKTLQFFISTSDGYLKWRIKAWLSSESTPDLLSLLPPEIQLKILKYIDGSSLVRVSQVSKVWNIILKNHKLLWKIKSKELGVNLEEKPPDISWNAAFFSSWKQLHYLEKGTAFKEKFIDLQNCKKSVKAIDYHQGFVCAVSDEDRITIWHLELNCPVLSFMAIPAVSCIKFKPNSTLVCGHFTGILSSWDLRSMSYNHYKQHSSGQQFINEDRYYSEFCLLNMKFSMHSAPVFSCDFSKDLQLLVSGSADETIKFWCLQTGQQLHNLNCQNHWILKVILIPSCSNSSVNSLIAMTRESVDKFDWACKGMDNSEGSDSLLYKRGNFSNIVLTSKIKLNQNNDNFITPGLQMCSKYVGLVKQDLQEKQAILVILHASNFLLFKETPLNFKVRKLLAIGNRFALLLTVGKVLYTSTLVIVDIISNKIVGTYSIPHSKMTTPDGAQIIVGDTQWLDGLSGWDKLANLPITTHPQKPCISCDIDSDVVSSSGSLEDLGQKCQDFNIGVDGSDELHYQSLKSMNRVSKEMSNLVLAAGIKDHVGRIFTLWWKGDEQEKKKVD